MKKTLLVLVFVLICTVSFAAKFDPSLSGDNTATIGTGGTYDYTSLETAFADFKSTPSVLLAGNWTFLIETNLTETNNTAVGRNTNGKTVTIKPGTGKTPTITFTRSTDNSGPSGHLLFGMTANNPGDYTSVMAGTNNITIDGSNTVGGTTRDLTLTNSGANFDYNTIIAVLHNTDNFTLKNCKVIQTSTTGNSRLCGINLFTRDGNSPDNWLIKNCYISSITGPSGVAINVTYSGTIVTTAQNGFTIEDNEVYGRMRGIFVNDGYNYNVRNNKVIVGKPNASNGFGASAFWMNRAGLPAGVTAATYNVYNNSLYCESANTYATGYGVTICYLGTAGTGATIVANIYNNYMEGKLSGNPSTNVDQRYQGIQGSSGITWNIFNNTIYMPTPASANYTNASQTNSWCIGGWATSVTTWVTIKNNIIFYDLNSVAAVNSKPNVIKRTQNATSVTAIDNNVYYYNASLEFGRIGTGPTIYTTFDSWKAGSGQDAASKVYDYRPVVANDMFHIKKSADSSALKCGVSGAGIPATDKDGDAQTSPYYVGCDVPSANDSYLYVISSQTSTNNPNPPVGYNAFRIGTTQTASASDITAGTTKYVVTGWTGSGDAEISAGGAANTITYSHDADSTLTWQFKTQYQLTTDIAPAQAKTEAAGTITPASGSWFDAGTVVPVQFTPANSDWIFDVWSGAITTTSNPDNVTMDAAKSVVANIKWAEYTAIDPTTIDFGTKPTIAFGGSAETKTFVVKNDGTVQLQLSAFNRTGSADFDILNSTPVSIDAGSTVALQVRYTPNTAGAVAANFVIVTNDPSEDGALAVTGQGLANVFDFLTSSTAYSYADSQLSEQVSAADMINGIDGTIVSGGFHSAYTGGVAPLTNGTWDTPGVTALVNDYGLTDPAIVVEYPLTNATIDKIVIFAGHDGDGARAFINCKVETKHSAGGAYTQLAGNLTTGAFGTAIPNTQTVSLVKFAGTGIDTGVYGIKFSFYGVSNSFNLAAGFAAPGADAINGTIVKEIDVFGQNKVSVDDWSLLK